MLGSQAFSRGPVSFDPERGLVTIGLVDNTILAHLFAQPQPFFEIKTARDSSRFTNNGVEMLTRIANGTETPYLIRSGYGLMAALLISPGGLQPEEIEEMRFNRRGERLILILERSRFGVAGASALVFSPEYSKQLVFVGLELLDEDES